MSIRLPTPKNQFLFALVISLLLVACALVLLGIVQYRNAYWKPGEAVVTAVDWTTQRSGSRTYRNLTVHYRFSTDDGRTLEGRDTVHDAEHLNVRSGEPIKILFNPGSPEDNITIYGIGGLMRFVFLFGIVGLLVGAFSGQRWWKYLRNPAGGR